MKVMTTVLQNKEYFDSLRFTKNLEELGKILVSILAITAMLFALQTVARVDLLKENRTNVGRTYLLKDSTRAEQYTSLRYGRGLVSEQHLSSSK